MIKSYFSKIYAKKIAKRIEKWRSNPIKTQQKVFIDLIENAKNTTFGKDHSFKNITSYSEFKKQVPVRDYEGLKPYIEQIINGKTDVLWKGKPIYFAKTSGTTSGAKYIPITKVSMKHMLNGTKYALLNYIHKTGKTDWIDGKMIFLQGSPELDETGFIKVGRLSGISAHFIPAYLQKNRMPSWETNSIEDWETKVNAIVKETMPEKMTVIGGIPSWVQMYFERLNESSGKKVGELFPDFSLFVYGGVNYEPYRNKMENLIGRKVDSIELFPASEGFFAFQDIQNETGMLLILDGGIFYEFIPADEYFEENPTRISLKDVKLNVNYVLIVSTNAGLWAYNIGDTIQFISLNPYRIIVSGRIKHFISAFGEHVIVKEVETAIQEAIKNTDIRIHEFTVAPQITPKDGLPYHEWFIEFENEPKDLEKFALKLDTELVKQNTYYKDLIDGKILKTLLISKVEKNGFLNYMKSIGKLGGQNKIPRLSDNRKIVDKLEVNY